jgi:hypothetical protein
MNEFGAAMAGDVEPLEVRINRFELIIVTHYCDLEQRRVRLVATCPIFPLAEFEAINPDFSRKGRWNQVLKGRIEGLHLLAAPMTPQDNRQALVVDNSRVPWTVEKRALAGRLDDSRLKPSSRDRCPRSTILHGRCRRAVRSHPIRAGRHKR